MIVTAGPRKYVEMGSGGTWYLKSTAVLGTGICMKKYRCTWYRFWKRTVYQARSQNFVMGRG